MTQAVRPADKTERSALAGTLARANHDDPLMTWFVPDEDRWRTKSVEWFELVLRTMWPEPDAGEVLTVDGCSGVAIWRAPGKWRVSPFVIVRLLPTALRVFGIGTIGRVVRTLAAVEKCHPREEHWYLELLGTDPPMQRRGIGAALMAPILGRCDEQGLPAYLETQKLENVAYYRHHGFEVREELDLPGDGGPHLWTMWRASRTGG
jgi:GNAT superfamily N-acetyltransferase